MAVASITADLPERPPFAPPQQLRVQFTSASAAVLERTKRYLDWCQRENRLGGDCADVLDGASIFPEDARAGFALHVALSGAVSEAGKSLRSIRPEQVRAALSLAILVSAGLMMSPDPVSKILAIGLACNQIAYLGVDLFNHVVRGYLELRHVANGTERFEDLVAIGDWYATQLGPSIARITVMLATWGIVKLGGMVPAAPTGLPGATAAAANAEAAGLPLGQMAAVEGVVVSGSGTVTVALGGTVAMAVGYPAGSAPVDEEPSSEKLDRNMQAAGMKRPPGTAAHHIVAGGAEPAREARMLLEKKFKIGINDAHNGVYLRCNSQTPCGEPGAIHSKLHTERYYRAVNRVLQEATTREEAISRLRTIAEQLKTTDGFP